MLIDWCLVPTLALF